MKKSKRLIGIILAAVMLLTTVQAAFIVGAAQTNSIKVATISDIRYQANTTDKDGLLLSKSAAIFDAALANVKKSNADVLLVTGDLTNNGSRAAHEYIANKLKEVQAEGIKVLVIPGEHDVKEGGTVTAISKADFEKIYKDLGYAESKQDFSSASYVADLGNNFAVVMSDSVAADGKGQMTQWVVDQAKSEIASGKTVFAASHHPIVTRGSVDRTFIDLLYTVAGVEIDLGGKHKLFTENPTAVAEKLGLADRTSVPGASANALIDAGVKFLFSGHGGTLSVAGATTTNGGQLYDIMSGSLVNASASVRYTTLYRGIDNMKEQRAEFTTEMITSAEGVDDVEAAAHAALKKNMPKEVDYAVDKAEKVLVYIVRSMKPNVINLVKNLDVAALAPDMAGLLNILGGTIQSVKHDLAVGYVGPLFDIVGNPQKIHNIIVDLRSAFEKMDFNGQDFYGFLTDVFITIQKGDGKAPASVEGIFQSIRDKDGTLLVGMVESFADNFNSANLVSLINEILDHRFSGKYLGTLNINVQLRGMLAGPYNVTSGIYTYTLDLWNMLDTSIVLPNGKKVSQVVRPLVNDLILGAPNNASTKQTPQRFNDNLRKDANQIVNLLFDFNVGDMIGNDVFAQGQRGALVAKTITLDELGANLQKLVPNNDVASINPADWEAVRDTLNAAGRFTPEQLATVNKVLVPADTVNNIPAVTQLDKLNALANAEFYKGVADDFTRKVNALPPVDSLELSDAAQVYALQHQYVQFYSQIKANISAQTVDKLNKALAKIGALENYDPDVDAVIKKIDEIGKPVTVESEEKINLALDAYKALDVRQQKKVTNYQDLVDAQEALKLAKENAVIIKGVEDKITAIGVVENNSASKIKIDLARQAYENLDKALQPSVKNYQDLVDAENRYKELKAQAADLQKAQPVIEQIKLIGKVTLNSKTRIENAEKAYSELTEAQQKLVTNYEDLVNARQQYEALAAAELGNKQAAQRVTDMIDKLNPVTISSGEAIEAAKLAYNELSPEQKDLVKNYGVLENAEETYKQLVKVENDKAAAQKVVEEIAAIGRPITVDKQDKIEKARESYNKLTTDQRRYVNNIADLKEAEDTLSILKNDFLFDDAATGIIVRADSGVVPADTVMTVKQHVSGDMYDKIMAKGYKAIHLYDISLAAGGKNVVPTKNVKISIPQFALDTEVFKVNPDGSLVPVNAALERGSFTFTNANVGTFVVVQNKVYTNNDKLDEAIMAYEALDASNYDEVDFAYATQRYEAAVSRRAEKVALTSAEQRKSDSIAEALNDAIYMLDVRNLDTTKIKSALYEAKMLDSADYKDFSAVTQAVDAAEVFLAGDHDIRSQADADRLAKNINNAVLALTYKDADFTLIEEALKRVPKDLQNYTDDSIAVLRRAIDDAKQAQTTITRKDENWKAQVEAKAKAVDAAIAKLVPVGDAGVNTDDILLALTIVDLYYPNDYVDFSGVESAVMQANALLSTKLTSDKQADVDAAADSIYSAIHALTWA